MMPDCINFLKRIGFTNEQKLSHGKVTDFNKICHPGFNSSKQKSSFFVEKSQNLVMHLECNDSKVITLLC